jgi:hypothetical protein
MPAFSFGVGYAPALLRGAPPPLLLPTHWFSPAGAGSLNGTSPANARPISQLGTVVNANGGGRYGLLSGADYPVTGSGTLASITAACAEGNRGRVYGCDANGKPAPVWFVGERTDWTLPPNPETVTDTTAWTDGLKEPFRLSGGASWLSFENLWFKRIGGHTTAAGASSGVAGCFWLSAGVSTGVSWINCGAYNVRAFLDMASSGAQLVNPFVAGIDAIGFSKNLFRFRGASYGGVVRSVRANSGRQNGDRFAVAFQLGNDASDPVHDFKFEDCHAENCHDTYTSGTYWNGDGWSVEAGCYNIEWDRCTSQGHTDAGIDCKATRGIKIRRSTLRDNKRNYRGWTPTDDEMHVLEECVIADAHHRGDNSGPAQIFLAGGATATDDGALVLLDRCRIEGAITSDTGKTPEVIRIEGHNAHLRARDLTLANPTGAANNNNQPTTSTIDLTGTAADTTAPTLAIPTAQNQALNQPWSVTLAASEPSIAWRIAGGADAASFTLSGSTLSLAASATPGTKTVVVRGWDKSGNPFDSTITVTNA